MNSSCRSGQRVKSDEARNSEGVPARFRGVVREGYDKVSRVYRGNAFDAKDDRCYRACMDFLFAHLVTGSRVLDLGCGCGIPAAQELSRKYHVTGVDFSPVQIERARQLVPDAEFVCADMTQVTMPSCEFDAVVALYSIIHVPLAEQPGLFVKIGTWLKPEGWLVCVVGHHAWTGMEENWLNVPGARMFWSHADQQSYERWLTNNGFRIKAARFIPEGNGGHTMFMAQRIAGEMRDDTVLRPAPRPARPPSSARTRRRTGGLISGVPAGRIDGRGNQDRGRRYEMAMSKDKALAELQHWRDLRKRYRLTNAQIEMARELGVRPDRLLQTLHVSEETGCELLGARIEARYRERFGKTCPDRVRSIRQLEREVREGKKSRRRTDRPDEDEARRQQDEATRVALLTLKRLKMGGQD